MSWKELITRFSAKKDVAKEASKNTLQFTTEVESKEAEGHYDQASESIKDGRDLQQGWDLQLSGSDESLPWIQLMVGFDFGTAFTKIVIAESRTRYAVPLGKLHGGEGFCLPCAIYLCDEGIASLQVDDKHTLKLTNLKMPLMGGGCDRYEQETIVVFFALVFRSMRSWFASEHKKTYSGKYFDWNINIGLPTEKFHDEKMVELYRTLSGAAWFLSSGNEDISFSSASASLDLYLDGNILCHADNDTKKRVIHTDQINCFPEFVAQVASYVKSPRRLDDLHLLVDIGAGTADVTVFNIHRDQALEDVFPIFGKGVKPLGTSYLLNHRYKKLGKKIPVDPTLPVPSNAQFVNDLNIEASILDDVDKEFCKNFRILVASELRRVKAKRYPKSPRWKTGIPCFLSGGGKDLEPYKNVLTQMMQEDYPFRIAMDNLPYPNDLDGASPEDNEYHRLFVAYGLSVDPFDIGKILKSQDVPDDDEPDPGPSRHQGDYISKEMT